MMKKKRIVEEKKRKRESYVDGEDVEINAMFDAVKGKRKNRKVLEKSHFLLRNDLRNNDDITVPVMKMSVNKAAIVVYEEAELDFNVPKERKLSSQPSSSSQRATRPEAASSVYLVRPQSKYNPEIVKA
ncbi:hypothetical protein CRYUN_Cryun24cG0090700 [Craigia yunnanensis]